MTPQKERAPYSVEGYVIQLTTEEYSNGTFDSFYRINEFFSGSCDGKYETEEIALEEAKRCARERVTFLLSQKQVGI